MKPWEKPCKMRPVTHLAARLKPSEKDRFRNETSTTSQKKQKPNKFGPSTTKDQPETLLNNHHQAHHHHHHDHHHNRVLLAFQAVLLDLREEPGAETLGSPRFQVGLAKESSSENRKGLRYAKDAMKGTLKESSLGNRQRLCHKKRAMKGYFTGLLRGFAKRGVGV